MALINCPECGKEISDKSKQCIHCGYPLKPKNICILNGIEQDLSFLIDGSCDHFDAVKKINELTGSCYETCCLIVDDIMKTKQIPPVLKIQTKQEYLDSRNNKNIPKCPTCGSTNLKKISGLSKAGSVALWGIFAAGRTSKTWHCNACGTEW